MKRTPDPQAGCTTDCVSSVVRVDAAGMQGFSPQVRNALIALKTALSHDPGVMHVQVTLDDVGVRDKPPTVDVIPAWYHWEPGQTRPPRHPGGPNLRAVANEPDGG